jgi:predicted membrane channel-forming protein YqfA (hemolysin III family)
VIIMMTSNDETGKPGTAHWAVIALIALTLLLIVFGLAFLISGRDVIERPLLIFFLTLAWLGLLSGISLGRSN